MWYTYHNRKQEQYVETRTNQVTVGAVSVLTGLVTDNSITDNSIPSVDISSYQYSDNQRMSTRISNREVLQLKFMLDSGQ